MTTTRHLSGLDWQMTETQSYRCQSVFCQNTECCCKKVSFSFCYTFNNPEYLVPKAITIYSSKDDELILARCSICNHKWRFVTDSSLQSLHETWQHMNIHKIQLTKIATQFVAGMRQDEPCPLQYLSIFNLRDIFTYVLGGQN